MLNIDRVLGDDRLIKPMTGLYASEFNELIESFREEFQNETWVRCETGDHGSREHKRDRGCCEAAHRGD